VNPATLPIGGGILTVQGTGFGLGGHVSILQRVRISDTMASPGIRAVRDTGVLATALGHYLEPVSSTNPNALGVIGLPLWGIG